MANYSARAPADQALAECDKIAPARRV